MKYTTKLIQGILTSKCILSCTKRTHISTRNLGHHIEILRVCKKLELQIIYFYKSIKARAIISIDVILQIIIEIRYTSCTRGIRTGPLRWCITLIIEKMGALTIVKIRFGWECEQRVYKGVTRGRPWSDVKRLWVKAIDNTQCEYLFAQKLILRIRRDLLKDHFKRVVPCFQNHICRTPTI